MPQISNCRDCGVLFLLATFIVGFFKYGSPRFSPTFSRSCDGRPVIFAPLNVHELMAVFLNVRENVVSTLLCISPSSGPRKAQTQLQTNLRLSVWCSLEFLPKIGD